MCVCVPSIQNKNYIFLQSFFCACIILNWKVELLPPCTISLVYVCTYVCPNLIYINGVAPDSLSLYMNIYNICIYILSSLFNVHFLILSSQIESGGQQNLHISHQFNLDRFLSRRDLRTASCICLSCSFSMSSMFPPIGTRGPEQRILFLLGTT